MALPLTVEMVELNGVLAAAAPVVVAIMAVLVVLTVELGQAQALGLDKGL